MKYCEQLSFVDIRSAGTYLARGMMTQAIGVNRIGSPTVR
jgi:hypothetical protein